MHVIETNDPVTWEFLRDTFSLFKIVTAFTGNGADNGMEQENKILKMSGGVIGITQQDAALNRFCLLSPIFSHLSGEFYNIDSLE